MASRAAQIRKRKNKFRKFTERRGTNCCRSQEDLVTGANEKCRLIDYKFLEPLQKCMTVQGKMFSRKRSGYCAQCQRQVKIAIKRARYMGLLPYVG
ncbi:MAG TPA: 30S ribosomal protein S18 [Planctomycetes bacterium]|nr:30S ribosomal protein S18 [Planctomycetota bacterium]